MKKELSKAYKITEKLFPHIGKICKNCNTCCKTYGWLLKEEAKKFIEKGFPIVEINKSLFCIDSFYRTKRGRIILNKIPRCIFYKKKHCVIHKDRPLDCRLYPLKIKFRNNKIFLGISLGCKYISSKNKKEKEKTYERIKKYIKQIPYEVLQEYIEVMAKVDKISVPKRFWMKKIAELKKGRSG
jgi:Fe-S-cluster containining protein